MAFFEDLGKKITQTSQGVVQKTKDTAEVIKLNGMISDEEKRIKNLYTQIGKKYFELHSDSYEQELESFVVEIKTAQEKIEDYSEQVKKLKGIVRCPNCGGDVQYGSPFCSTCGSRMETPSVQTDAIVKRCSACGSPIADGCAFCTHCGTKVEETPIVESKPEIQPDIARLCPNCNTAVDNDSAFCMNCGTKISKVADLLNTVEEPVVEEPSKLCPNCNNQVTPDAVFCVSCGTKLDD